MTKIWKPVYDDKKAEETTIVDIRHPEYQAMETSWVKWRYTYEGGDSFLQQYVQEFSAREDSGEFKLRKELTPIPAFAKAGINDIKNAIFQRTTDITREGGTKSYQEAILGKNHGVDFSGNTMNGFIGRLIINELLVMKKVGIYVDMPRLDFNITIADTETKRPYIYRYKAEDILSWAYESDEIGSRFTELLLRDYVYQNDPETQLPMDLKTRFRYYWIENGIVNCQLYDDKGNKDGEVIIINIKKIPFVLLEISNSLLADVANHQIALANLESSDIAYLLKSNFPFYTEQRDPRWTSPHLRGPAQAQGAVLNAATDDADGKDTAGSAEKAALSASQKISVGTAQGRAYPIGTERPGFISPSSEPVKASMEKQNQLKRDIRLLLNLSLSSIQPKTASAESKSYDERSLEAGLSAVGLELEYAERQVAEVWSAYEGSKDVATVKYPEKYSLQSEADIRDEIQEAKKNMEYVPSKTYQKEMAKRIVDKSLGPDISYSELEKIKAEIEAAEVIIVDPEIIVKDVEAGIVSKPTASKARNYPDGEVDKAKEEHAERLALIAESQSKGAARGVKDLDDPQNQSGKTEKAKSRQTDRDPIPKDKTRGPAE